LLAGTTGADANGKQQVPGTIPPDREHYRDLNLRRTRLGVRGTVLPLSKDIDYFFMTELGDNGVTCDDQAAGLLDALMTFFCHVPGR